MQGWYCISCINSLIDLINRPLLSIVSTCDPGKIYWRVGRSGPYLVGRHSEPSEGEKQVTPEKGLVMWKEQCEKTSRGSLP